MMDQNRDGIIDEGDLEAIFQQTGKARLTQNDGPQRKTTHIFRRF